jgi:hypothetical protein
MGIGDLMPIVQNGVTKKLPYAGLISSLAEFSDSIYVNYRCHSVKGQSKWYAIGDTIYIDTCSVTGSLGGAEELNDLSDVTLTDPDAGDLLIVDDNTMQWVNVPLSELFVVPSELDDLSDVTITAPDSADILIFNDDLAQWINVPQPLISAGATELNDLSDVTLTQPDAGDILRLDDNSMQWVNVPLPIAAGGVSDGEQGLTTANQVYDFVTGQGYIISEGDAVIGNEGDTTKHHTAGWGISGIFYNQTANQSWHIDTAKVPSWYGVRTASVSNGVSTYTTGDQVYDFVTGLGYLTAEVDALKTNEGSLSVGAGTASTSKIVSNTSGSSAVVLSAGTGITLSEADSTITIASSSSSGYAISFGSASIASTDGTTLYYMAANYASTSTVARVYIPKSGTITVVYFWMWLGSNGSCTNEPMTCYVRLNSTTDYAIETVSTTDGGKLFHNLNMNISVLQGDYISIKSVNPTWVTNPSGGMNGCTGLVIVQ